MMKTPEQLKGAIRNLAKKKGIHAQEVLQIFMFERIIERLSVSPYKDRFILKGGLLISAILGVAERTTMDMDTTVKGLPMDEQSIRKVISEILDQTVDDGIGFQLLDLTPIREDDEYENFRASVQATYGKMKIPMKIDITTGDEITPKEIQFSYPFLFDDRRVMVKAYTQETILAEKYETIIRRYVGNSRARDFYDLHLLYRLYRENADWTLLKPNPFRSRRPSEPHLSPATTKARFQPGEETPKGCCKLSGSGDRTETSQLSHPRLCVDCQGGLIGGPRKWGS